MDELEEDGAFSVRGGAFSLLGPISKGSVGGPDAVTEDDAALAAFDKTLEQEPDDPDQLEAEELWEEAFEGEPLEEPLEEPGKEVTGGKGAWKGHSPGLGTMPKPKALPEDFEEEEVEVEVEVEVEEEEEEEVLEEEPPIVTQSSSFKVASDRAPVKAKDSSSDGPPKGTAGTAGSWSNESKLQEEEPAEEKVEDEETDDDDEEEIGISKGKAWLKGKGREMDKSKGKGSDKGKSWGSSSSEWSRKGWKGEDWWRPSWWGKGDWGKGDWGRRDWSKGEWNGDGKGQMQDWSGKAERDVPTERRRQREYEALPPEAPPPQRQRQEPEQEPSIKEPDRKSVV